MAVTIKQIASVAGVSRGTVDRALHNRPGVKPEIAQQIREIAASLGFEPNRAGKILATRKQPIKIGCFLPGVGNPFFDDVKRGFLRAEAELADFGVSVEISNIEGYKVKDHIRAINGLIDNGCVGLCICTVDVPEIREYVNDLAKQGIPVIAVNTDISKTNRICYVGCDYYNAGQTAAGLLALTSPKWLELFIVIGSLNIKGHNDRIRGFSQTLRNKMIPYKVVEVLEAQDNDERAYKMTVDILKNNKNINCIYIAAAGVGGVCKAILQLGLQDKILVVSHDEISITQQMVKDSVIDFTIGQEPEEQGYRSIELLFNYFIGNKKIIPSDYITGTIIKIKENIDQSEKGLSDKEKTLTFPEKSLLESEKSAHFF